ncbi:MAG: aminopeptidase P family N-terminal domain-containing protein, partial [Tenericutes bacterium]|nr:aminopeptidase P family N-terminal domain-containing protein [Mycoplasmatota bacterium]
MILDKIQEKIKNSDFDAVLLTGLENPVAAKNLRYVTGYTGSFGFAIIGKDYQYFLSDFRYRDQVAVEVPDFTFIEINGGFVTAIKGIIEKEKIDKLGFDKKMRYS